MKIIILTGLVSVVLPVIVVYLFDRNTNWEGEPEPSLEDDSDI